MSGQKNPIHDSIPVDRHHHGDRRADGFRFYIYQKWHGRYYETWLSPTSWERHIEDSRRRSRERTKLAAKRKEKHEERLSCSIAANGQLCVS